MTISSKAASLPDKFSEAGLAGAELDAVLDEIEKNSPKWSEWMHQLKEHERMIQSALGTQIPPHMEGVRVDIGTSWTGPTTYTWTRDLKRKFIICVEPHEGNANRFQQFIRAYVQNLVSTGAIANHDTNAICLLNRTALDNVSEPKMGRLYATEPDAGNSSLLKPTALHVKQEMTKVQPVYVYSFKTLLEAIPWDRFEYIEAVKIDAQGKDLDILKSAGEYLQKIVYLQVETTTHGLYDSAPTQKELLSFLEENNFVHSHNVDGSYIKETHVDQVFINREYIHLKDKIKLSE